jgi:hypothetical protein
MRSRHFRQCGPYILGGHVLQRDRADKSEQRPQRVPVDLNLLGGTVRQTFGQPVNDSLLNDVAMAGTHARV